MDFLEISEKLLNGEKITKRELNFVFSKDTIELARDGLKPKINIILKETNRKKAREMLFYKDVEDEIKSCYTMIETVEKSIIEDLKYNLSLPDVNKYIEWLYLLRKDFHDLEQEVNNHLGLDQVLESEKKKKTEELVDDIFQGLAQQSYPPSPQVPPPPYGHLAPPLPKPTSHSKKRKHKR